jgi:hypothetical protein
MQKTVTFIAHNITREFLSDHLKGQFRFSVIDSSLIGTPKERDSIHTVEVTMTDYLMDYWRLAGVVDPTIVTDDMIKVVFQIAEDYITEQLEKGSMPEGKLPPKFMSTENSSKSCPYKISNIAYPDKTTFTVEISDECTEFSVTNDKEAMRQELLQRQSNLNKLKEKEAIYALGETPLYLLNQIEHEEKRITELKTELGYNS